MKQLFVVAALAACSSSSSESLVSWLDRWEDHRRCWVGEANYAIEVELAARELAGKRCRATFEARPDSVPDFAVTVERVTRLASALPHAPSSAQRAEMIRAIDRDVLRMRRIAGLESRPHEIETALPMLESSDVVIPPLAQPPVVASLGSEHRAVTITIQPHRHYDLATSSDAGKTWKTTRYPQLAGLAQHPVRGDVELFLDYKHTSYLARFTRDGFRDKESGLENAVVVGTPSRDGWRVACRADSATWVVGEGQITRVRGEQVTRYKSRWLDARTTELACDDDGSVVLHHGRRYVESCAMGVCNRELDIPHARRGAVAMLGDGWLYAASLDGVVGVWRPTARPRFYRVPMRGDVDRIEVIDGVAYVAIDDRVVRLPSSDEQ